MNDLVMLIQAIVRDQLACWRNAELGVVTKVYAHEAASDYNNYQCDVQLRDSGLELQRVMVATQRIGAAAIPNVNDLVLVQFLNGDIHRAVIMGRLYDDVDRPPVAKPQEFVYISPDAAASNVRRFYIELPNNNKLRVDDDKLELEMGKTKLTVNHDGEVILNSNNQNITLTDQNGSNQLEIKVQSGQVTLKGQAKVVVEAPQIELVQNAMHPLVYGDDLVQYLNQVSQMYQSHVHPGQMAAGVLPVSPAPPVPPFPPATPALLSMKVKTG